MIYVARYGGRAYYEAMAAASEWAAGDGYYRSPCGYRGISGFDYRCGCTGESDGNNGDPSPADIADWEVVRWLACSGNLQEYRFDHTAREVVLFYSGARHGINCRRLADNFEWQEPIEVIRYETATPHWRWYETLDDHPEDRQEIELRFGKET